MKRLFLFLVLAALALSLAADVKSTVYAQLGSSRTTTPVCQDDLTGAVYFVPASGFCQPGATLRSVQGTFSVMCVVGTAGSFNIAAPIASGGTSSTFTCENGTTPQTIRPAQNGTTPPPTQTPPTQTPPTQTPPTQTPPTQQPPTQTPPTQQPPTSGTIGCVQKGPLCIPNNPFSGNQGIAGSGSLGQLAVAIISILLYLAGIIAVIFIIIGGYYYMTAAGNDARALSGRKTLVNALIGLGIVILSFLIVQIVTNFLVQGSGT